MSTSHDQSEWCLLGGDVDALDADVRRGEALVVYALDLNRSKAVNDTFGHAVGDERLRRVAHQIDAVLPAEAFAASPGGDEFVVVETRASSPDAVPLLAQGLIEVLRMSIVTEGHEITIGTSVGVSTLPGDGSAATSY